MRPTLILILPALLALPGINACPTPTTDMDGDGFSPEEGDCDDTNPAINPAAPEACNGIDDNCDGLADEGLPQLDSWADDDGDGFGDGASEGEGFCALPDGYVENNEDCDDSDDTINPDAEEICDDGVDNNCDALGCALEGEMSLGQADGTIRGGSAGDNLGRRVAGVGDINGDGYTDFMVSAHLNDVSATNAGAAYLFHGPLAGGAIDVSQAAAVIFGVFTGENVGFPVARGGDINGDGFGDILIGAFLNDQAGTDAGAVYVVNGPIEGEIYLGASASAVILGEAQGDNAGRGIAGVGDLNNDGFDDIVIGAPGHRATGRGAGAVYVVNGPLQGQMSLSAASAKFTGQAIDNKAGLAVARAGDVNGDGVLDILVGAHTFESSPGVRPGAVYVLEGPFSGTKSLSTAAATIVGAAATDYFGWSVASAGDINGDGLPDIMVGAPFNDVSGVDAGAAYLFESPLSGVIGVGQAVGIIRGSRAGDRFGISVTSPGDVDGDSAPDVLVGANREDTSAADAGAAYLVYGPVSGTMNASAADATFLGEAAGDYAGQSVAGVGDVSGDGFPDIIVGAALNDATGSNAGAAYVLFGQTF